MADTLDLIDFTPTPDQLAYTFGGVAPIRRITPGSVLRLWSEDAFGGVLRSVTDLSSEKIDLRFVNPQTGPFYVDGAEPGDALALHFVSVEPARDWAASATIPFFGGLTSTDRTATLQDPLPDTTWIYSLTGPGARCDSRPGTASSPSTSRSPRCSERSAWPRPAMRCAARSSRTVSAATWTPRRCAPARPASSA